MRRPLRGSLLHEFFEALGDLSTRCTQRNREQAWFPLPALIGTDESQPVIPWWVALPQSPPPLDRPNSECCTVVLPVERFTANGDECLNRLCQPRGQPHFLSSSLWLRMVGIGQAADAVLGTRRSMPSVEPRDTTSPLRPTPTAMGARGDAPGAADVEVTPCTDLQYSPF